MAERLCPGCGRLELPSFALRLELSAALLVRCEEVRGGGMGPPAVALGFMAGEFCVDGGCARGALGVLGAAFELRRDLGDC